MKISRLDTEIEDIDKQIDNENEEKIMRYHYIETLQKDYEETEAFILMTSLFDNDNNGRMFTEVEKMERIKISRLDTEIEDIENQIDNETKKMIMLDHYIDTLHEWNEETEDLIRNLTMKKKMELLELAHVNVNTGSAAEVADAEVNTEIQPLRKRAKGDGGEEADDGKESTLLFRQQIADAVTAGLADGVTEEQQRSPSCVTETSAQREVMAESGTCGWVDISHVGDWKELDLDAMTYAYRILQGPYYLLGVLRIKPHTTRAMSCKNALVFEV